MNIGKWKLSLQVAVLGAAVGMSSTAIGQVADVAETLPAAPPDSIESPATVDATAPSPLDEPARVDRVSRDELPAVSTTIAPAQPARAAFPALPPLDEFPPARAYTTQPALAPGQQAAPSLRYADVPPNVFRAMGAQRAVPKILQVAEISGDERKALQEDLQVLESLINKAIVGKNHSPDVNMALGVTLYRSEQTSYLTWIQDSGLLYQRSLSGVSLAPRSATGSKKDGGKTDEPESEWDAARRELAQSEETDLFGAGFAGNQRLPVYDEETVESLKKRVAGALKNVGRVRFPQSSAGIAQVCTIALTCPEDGSTITFRIRVTPGEGAAEVGEVSSWQYIDESQASNEPLAVWGSRFVAPPEPPAASMEPVAPNPVLPLQPRRPSTRANAIDLALPADEADPNAARALSPDSASGRALPPELREN